MRRKWLGFILCALALAMFPSMNGNVLALKTFILTAYESPCPERGRESLSPSIKKAPSPEWKGKIEIKNGIKIIKNPEKPLYGKIALELEKDLVIGDSSDQNTLFYYRISADTDRQGNIFIWDPNSFRIQKFDKTGKFLQTIGRKGEGPGEFMEPFSLTFKVDDNGNLFVKDSAKIHFFDAHGRFQKFIPVSTNTRQFMIMAEGNILRNHYTFARDQMSEDVILTDSNGKILKAIASYPSMKFNAWIKHKARFTVFFPELILCPWINDSALYGFPSEYRLFVADSRGKIVSIIEKEESPAKITSKERDKEIDEIMDQLESKNPQRKESRQELEKRTFFPDNWPFFEAIFCDEEGRIFLQRLKSNLSQETGFDFDFFSPNGIYLYRLIVPETVLLIKGGFVYSRRYNSEMESDQLIRYKIKNWGEIKKKCREAGKSGVSSRHPA